MIPLQWILALAVSVLVHEAGHFFALLLLKLPVHGISVYPLGIRIQTQPLSDKQDLICAAAGPLCGACLILFAKWFPGLAMVSLFHSLYNLLPVYPADGGRVLHSLARLLLPHRIAEWLAGVLQWIAVGLIILLGWYAAFILRLGLLPLLAGIVMALGTMKRK